jgi:hypothetical protein
MRSQVTLFFGLDQAIMQRDDVIASQWFSQCKKNSEAATVTDLVGASG